MRFVSAMAALFIVLCGPSLAAPDRPYCDSLESCIAQIESWGLPPSESVDGVSEGTLFPSKFYAPIGDELARFGPATVQALRSLLHHDDPNVRYRAGKFLNWFEPVPPEQAAEMIKAHRNGEYVNLKRLARTGTDEALNYLWQVFLIDPSHPVHSQTADALGLFADRLRPLIQNGLKDCRAQDNVKLCRALWSLAYYRSGPPNYVQDAFVNMVEDENASESIQNMALDTLIDFNHPLIMDRFIDRVIASFEKHPSRRATRDMWPAYYERNDNEADPSWTLSYNLTDLANYGPAAKRAAPALRRALSWDDYPKLRTDVVHTLGMLQDREAIPLLRALAPKFNDDYALAYTTVEALARLEDQESVSLLQNLSETYWYKPVRRNADRALAYQPGADFYADQTNPKDEFYLLPNAGPIEMDYDMYDADLACRPTQQQDYGQYRPSNLQWPAVGSDPVTLAFTPMTQKQTKQVMRNPDKGLKRSFAAPVFFVELGDWEFFGFDHGEWGGAVFVRGPDGIARPFIDDNANQVLRLDHRLFILTGLSHLVGSNGQLHIVDMTARGPKLVRRIRMPIEPRGVALFAPDIIALTSAKGDFVMRTDGTILDPRDYADCHKVKYGGWVTPSGTPCGDLEGCISKLDSAAALMPYGPRRR